VSGDTYASLLAAREALNVGHTENARQILLSVVKEDPDNFYGWLWLAGLVDSQRERLACLRRAQRIRPNDPALAKAWSWASSRIDDGPALRPEATNSNSMEGDTGPARISSSRRSASKLLWRSLAVFGLLLVAAGTFVAAGLIYRGWHANASPSADAPLISAEIAASSAQELDASQPSATALSDASDPSRATATSGRPLPTATQNPFRPKQIAFTLPEVPPTWTATPQPTSTPVPSATPLPTFVADMAAASARPLGLKAGERWIDVSLDRQYLIAYEGLNPVFESKVSTGMARWPTVTGQFRIYLRFEAQDMDGYRLGYDYYLKDVPYVQYFFEDYALHGTYWHNRFGTPLSHGCVNLPTPAAEWLYRWADYGTLVNIHS
jgi:lipoprotein-anchoring transpeptidase ErfK/SrfK